MHDKSLMISDVEDGAVIEDVKDDHRSLVFAAHIPLETPYQERFLGANLIATRTLPGDVKLEFTDVYQEWFQMYFNTYAVISCEQNGVITRTFPTIRVSEPFIDNETFRVPGLIYYVSTFRDTGQPVDVEFDIAIYMKS
jgi:hypothetical protein